MKIICSILVSGMQTGSALCVQCHLPESTCSGAANAIFMVENRNVYLAIGRDRTPARPASVATIATEIYGQPVCGDLNGDGRDDAALVLVRESGGSGSFYYVAAAIAENGIYRGTNAILFGDRVVPGSINIQNHVIIVDYADRRPDHPMAVPPSVEKNMRLKLTAGLLHMISPGR